MSRPTLTARTVLVGLALLCGTQPACVPAMPPDSLDAETHRQVLVEVADVMRDHYADPEAGEAIADTLMAHIEKGGADSSIDVQALVAKVMGVIRPRVPDRHFDFSDRSRGQDDSGPSSRRSRSQHGLRTVRVLEGQTAYLEFDGFPGDEASLKAIANAIEKLPDMRAAIFDLRDNNGGAGDMVVLLCNHLLEADVLLYTFAGRSDDVPAEMKTSPIAQRFGTAIPVFILTSGDTLSAAEGFAYILQDLGRAMVVGERTAGMANPSRTFTIAGRFEMTVPFLTIRYGKSGGTFAGVGVAPDIEVSAESALEAALERLGKAD